jgi:hypothetical protein
MAEEREESYTWVLTGLFNATKLELSEYLRLSKEFIKLNETAIKKIEYGSPLHIQNRDYGCIFTFVKKRTGIWVEYPDKTNLLFSAEYLVVPGKK